jgi:hypothetical protein
MIGNCVATVVIAAWEKDLDHAKAKEVNDGPGTRPVEERAKAGNSCLLVLSSQRKIPGNEVIVFRNSPRS